MSEPKTKIRWGIVSTANINRRVIPAIRQSSRGELVAVSGVTQLTEGMKVRRFEP